MKILNGNAGRAGIMSLSALLLTCCGPLQPTHAEGSMNFGLGAWGVNRVIRTNNGFVAVDGTAKISFHMPTSAANRVIRETNPYDNAPSVYLGAEGLYTDGRTPVEADAGTQFETGLYREDATIGWSAFISRQVGRNLSVYTNPRVWVPGAIPLERRTQDNPEGGQWQAWRGGQIVANDGVGNSDSLQAYMRFDVMVATGAARLIFGAFNRPTSTLPNTFFWNNSSTFRGLADTSDYRPGSAANPEGHLVAPWNGVASFRTTDTALSDHTNVKRVVAMTRANSTDNGASPAHYELDGWYLKSTFTAGRVAPASGNRALRAWAVADVDDARTGYDAPGDLADPALLNHRAWDKRSPWSHTGGVITEDSRPIVEFFLGPYYPTTVSDYCMMCRRDVYDPNRYVAEGVRINLRTATRVVGNRLQYARP